jgi:PTH1 family peptidyl-tRNA hydrolase
MLSLLVGLGNPGKAYANTRHNVGFMLLDQMVAAASLSWKKQEKWRAELAVAPKATLMKPLTFMNLSGESVGSYCSFHKLVPAQVLVLLDDVSLPLGRLRFRSSGSAGGHNGLRSIIQHLGTDAVPRLRIGIGAGDIKLLSVLAFFFAPLTWDLASRFLLSFTLISATLLIIALVRSRSFAGSIALAPAICGAVIWCAR